MKKNQSKDPMSAFRPSGSFQFNNQSVVVCINRKTGQVAFQLDGKWVENTSLQDELMQAFQKANQLS